MTAIYAIICYTTNKFYIGSSINFSKRIKRAKKDTNLDPKPPEYSVLRAGFVKYVKKAKNQAT